MNKIKFVARLHYIDPISGKRYNDAQLMTINQYYEDSFLTEKTLDKRVLFFSLKRIILNSKDGVLVLQKLKLNL